MSIGYRNRRKAIKRLRKEYKNESTDNLKLWAVPWNDRWSRIGSILALKDRGVTVC